MANRAFDYSHYEDWRDPEDLIPYALNAKQHDEKQIRNIANSIRRFGWWQEAVITADGVLVIGHGRRLAAMQLGCKIPVMVIDRQADDLTEEDIRELRIADNKTNESPWDWEMLQQDMEGLDFEGFDFDFEGESTPEPEPEVKDDDYDKPIPEDPQSRPGQIWQLGDHRLMVGDSTKKDDIQALMDGVYADLLLTDPPYNVDYTGGTKEKLKIENDSMSDAAFMTFLQDAFSRANDVMKPGAAYYIWHADSNGLAFRRAIAETGWQLRQCLVWVKNTFVLGRQDYQWRHEPCLYGWKEGSHYFTDDRALSTVIEEKTDFRKLKKEQLIAILERMTGQEVQTSVMFEDKPLRNLIHPTMKPVTLMAEMVRNSTKRGGIVLDNFAGSGSTMIACEQLRRRCYAMEMDPRYADAIIDRWEQFTGGKAVLIRG